MNWLHAVSYFFGGACFANAVPHFVSGVMDEPFQRPFAKPPGKGLSSSTVMESFSRSSPQNPPCGGGSWLYVLPSRLAGPPSWAGLQCMPALVGP